MMAVARFSFLMQVAYAIALAGFVTARAKAQNPTTLQAFEKEPHLGNLEDALVGITVVNRSADGSVQTRHGNGLMLRCDGFVLAPEALFYTSVAGNLESTKPNQSITVVLHPGTARQQAVTGRRPGWFGWVESGNTRQHTGYAVLKLDNIHCAAMRTLMPDMLIAGDKVSLVWSVWDEGKHTFSAAQTRLVSIGERKPPAPDDKTPPLYREQFTPFSRPQEAVMPGAIVITGEDLVVGMIPGNAVANAARFANFASLHRATNCVTALPTGEDAFIQRSRPAASSVSPSAIPLLRPHQPSSALPQQATQTSPAEKRRRNVAASAPDMVSVPGGPVKLPPALMNLQLDMEASRIACVAPFLIDRFEVTNEQYLLFWKSLPEKSRSDPNFRADMYPYGWGNEAEPFPMNLAQVPVLGVRLPGARAYAKWAGKRLPTPYEWSLAAFGPSGGNAMPEWGRRYLKQRKDVWKKIVAAHVQYARQHPEVVPRFIPVRTDGLGGPYDLFRDAQEVEKAIEANTFAARLDVGSPGIPEFFHLPWFFYSANLQEASAWSKQTVEDLTEPLFQEWADPMYVLPVGSRPYDVSPYGAFDMLANAEELVVPSPIYPWNKPPRPDWPAREVDRYINVQWGILDSPTATATNIRYQWLDTGVSAALLGLGMNQRALNLKRLSGLEGILDLYDFTENPLHLWTEEAPQAHKGIPSNITAGNLLQRNVSVDTPTTLYDEVLPSLDTTYTHLLPRYTDHMPTRRLHSASENARPNTLDSAPFDLASFVRARAAMDEYSEMLRPADEMEVSLQPGPTYNMVYFPFSGVTLHNWQFVQEPEIERLPNGRLRKYYPNPPRWVDSPTYMNATWIEHAGAYSVWSERPRHYHQEMGHPPAEDRKRAAAFGLPPIGTKLAPDTFLVAGGFRCAR